jgi:predicted HTH transcriptional regulator
MFADRMEVISPGGLPGFITVDNLVEEHFSRNPRLVSGLFQWGYIEELGLGIDRMIEEMTQAGHHPPQFKALPYSFTVTLSNIKERRPMPQWEKAMNERQARALTYLRERGQITNREYQQLCPDVSAETLRLDLSDLVDRGVVMRIGAKKGTYYSQIRQTRDTHSLWPAGSRGRVTGHGARVLYPDHACHSAARLGRVAAAHDDPLSGAVCIAERGTQPDPLAGTAF